MGFGGTGRPVQHLKNENMMRKAPLRRDDRAREGAYAKANDQALFATVQASFRGGPQHRDRLSVSCRKINENLKIENRTFFDTLAEPESREPDATLRHDPSQRRTPRQEVITSEQKELLNAHIHPSVWRRNGLKFCALQRARGGLI